MRVRVLIADDEEQVLTGLAEMLESAGYSVIAKARTGREACELTAAVGPDVVLLDLRMPDMDGIEAARTIVQTAPTPIILCTAYCDEGLVVRAAEAGIYAYLLKPFHISDLVPAITVARYRCADAVNLGLQIQKLGQQLEARKWVEKAKGIVMKNRNLDEEQAHRYLQMESQRRSQPLVDLARAVVTAEEMLKVKVVGETAGALA